MCWFFIFIVIIISVQNFNEAVLFIINKIACIKFIWASVDTILRIFPEIGLFAWFYGFSNAFKLIGDQISEIFLSTGSVVF